MARKSMLAIGILSVSVALLGATAACAQDKFDKYSLKSPSGIAFADSARLSCSFGSCAFCQPICVCLSHLR